MAWMNEWFDIFNLNLRELIETRINKQPLVDELLPRSRIPSEYATCLTRASFDEASMPQNIQACEWLAYALRNLEAPNLDPTITSVREKLDKLKNDFVKGASEFMRNYFFSLVDFMISDKSNFSQHGQLKRPDHANLRNKCRTYAPLLQHLKTLDKSRLNSLRIVYCSSLNFLLRREAREFANELRASTKASNNPTVWLDGSTGSSQSASSADTSTVSEASAKMLTIFIPLLAYESSFFAHFMCFDVPASVPTDDENDDDFDDLQALNECLDGLLDGIQEEFYAVVDWAYKIDPLSCISMHGITKGYISGQKADAAGSVRKLLDDLENRISAQFRRFVDHSCHQFKRNGQNVQQSIHRFAILATHMEQYIQGQSRDLVDWAYVELVTAMFDTVDKNALEDPKLGNTLLLENYAALQDRYYSLYDLANSVPSLARFYHHASEAYEHASACFVDSIVLYHCERLFQFSRRLEYFLDTIPSEQILFQIGLTRLDLRKAVKSSLSGVDKSIGAMYKQLQKLSSEKLLPSLWDKCKKEFLKKYVEFAWLVVKIYPTKDIPPVSEIRDLLASL